MKITATFAILSLATCCFFSGYMLWISCAKEGKYRGLLTIRYKGVCEEDIICEQYSPPKKGEPVVCTMEYEPICGSDGLTHGNKCVFCAARWQSGGTLTIRYKGECKEEGKY
ncbi:serine protease inhibitor Kazal-type 6-like [Heteronotia binoei]|uniref:serine protease inhibitor Kazal-type 6-like n=1 Tax=Heteronotia binoei TaxID=13085 RepID=UPI00292FF201|nr:serine protease inhibitor Kazal-type 6-like [Heteronotia binoei]